MPRLPPLRATYVRRERQALCDTALSVGPEAPTLLEGWDTKDLICHLLVRESSLFGALGIALSPLSGLTEKEMARLRKQPFERLVERFRKPRFSFSALPPADAAFNTLELFVHHEDIRRAQVGWRRRNLSQEAPGVLWQALKSQGPVLVRSAGVPVVVRRTDTDEASTFMPGSDPVEVRGPVSELAMYLHGRDEVREIRFDGPADKVARIRRAGLGSV